MRIHIRIEDGDESIVLSKGISGIEFIVSEFSTRDLLKYTIAKMTEEILESSRFDLELRDDK